MLNNNLQYQQVAAKNSYLLLLACLKAAIATVTTVSLKCVILAKQKQKQTKNTITLQNPVHTAISKSEEEIQSVEVRAGGFFHLVPLPLRVLQYASLSVRYATLRYLQRS